MRRGVIIAALAAVFVPSGAEAQTSGGMKRRTCVECGADTLRLRALERLDSLRWEFEHERMSDAQRERLKRELVVAMKELQETIGAYTIEVGDLERARAEAWAPRGRAVTFMRRPTGYLGVSFDGPNTEEYRGGERIIRFYAYPRIALVEPSSPAERAGIRSGDTLLAMNGIDVLDKEISLTKMLVPDEALVVRLRRDGSAKDHKVVVGRPPGYVMERTTVAAAPSTPLRAAAPVRVGSTPLPSRAPAPDAPGAYAPAIASVWVYSSGVAGAKVETVGDGLGKALGVSGGVVILRVGPGTPANRAGLRDGDVIVRVAGSRVNTVRDLQAMLERYDEGNGVKLVIVRDRRQREVTLRQ